MPIYEYKCDECDHTLEKLQKISDEAVKICPVCGKNTLRRLVSAAAFKLKGSGWYETDFKDKKPKKDETISDAKKKDTKTAPDTETTSSKSETKSTASCANAKATDKN